MKKKAALVASQRGLSLIEIMIVVTIIAMVTAGVAVLAIGQWQEAKLRQAATDAQTLRSSVQLYWTNEGEIACPSPDDLLDEQVLDEGKSTEDPWGSPYTIECDGSRVWVKSAGPDGQSDSEDDIVVPQPRGDRRAGR
jgi:general secretion pathway protein G